MNTYIWDKIFQDTPRRVAKFCENRPRDVEKSVVGNLKKKKTRPKYNSLPLSLERYAGDCNNKVARCFRTRCICIYISHECLTCGLRCLYAWLCRPWFIHSSIVLLRGSTTRLSQFVYRWRYFRGDGSAGLRWSMRRAAGVTYCIHVGVHS